MTQATSRGMFSGCGVGLISSISGLVSIMPVSTQYAARGMVDCPDEYGPLFAVHDDVRCEVSVDHAPTLTARAARALYGVARRPMVAHRDASSARKLHKRLHTYRMLGSAQVGMTEKAPTCGPFAEQSSGLEPETPPYHGTSQATRGDRNGFGLFAASALSRFAVDCHWLQPRGSIKAPSFVAELGYIG